MDDEDKRKMLDILKRHGISKITADFNGGGDSGQVDNIDCDGLVSAPEKFPFPSDWPGSGSVGSNHFGDFLDQVVDELLQETDYDWYNNDGGFGQVIIIPGHDYIHVDMNLNETTSELYPLDLSPPEATYPQGEVTQESKPQSNSGFGVTLSNELTVEQQKELYYWLRGQLLTQGVING